MGDLHFIFNFLKNFFNNRQSIERCKTLTGDWVVVLLKKVGKKTINRDIIIRIRKKNYTVKSVNIRINLFKKQYYLNALTHRE